MWIPWPVASERCVIYATRYHERTGRRAELAWGGGGRLPGSWRSGASFGALAIGIVSLETSLIFEGGHAMDVGPVLYILIIILVILAIVYLFQRMR